MGGVAQLRDVPATAWLHSHYTVMWETPSPSPSPPSSRQILGILLSKKRNLRDLNGLNLDRALLLSSTGDGLLIFLCPIARTAPECQSS